MVISRSKACPDALRGLLPDRTNTARYHILDSRRQSAAKALKMQYFCVGVSCKDFCVVSECSCHTERVAKCHFVGCLNLCGGRTSAFRACQSPRIFLAKFSWCELIESARRFQKAKLRLRRQVRCLIRRETFLELQLGLWARLFVPCHNYSAAVLTT